MIFRLHFKNAVQVQAPFEQNKVQGGSNMERGGKERRRKRWGEREGGIEIILGVAVLDTEPGPDAFEANAP